MERLLRKLSGSAAETTALSLLFFILYYAYLWKVVDLRLIYQGGGIISNFPVFFSGWSFFQGYLCYAGGPVDYVSRISVAILLYRMGGCAGRDAAGSGCSGFARGR